MKAMPLETALLLASTTGVGYLMLTAGSREARARVAPTPAQLPELRPSHPGPDVQLLLELALPRLLGQERGDALRHLS